MKIKSIIQTSIACPSQWEITLTNGHMVYVRYRWGYLSMKISPEETTDIYDAVGGIEILGQQLSDSLHGVMDEKTMLEHFNKISLKQELW